MEAATTGPHNGRMRATPVPKILIAIAAAAAMVVALVGPAGAQTEPSTETGAEGIAIVQLDFEAENHLERLLGGSTRGTATALLTNSGDTAAAVTARVLADDGIFLMPEVTVAPGETVAVATEINLGPLNLRERDIVAVAGESIAVASHRAIPWLLIGLIALSANVVLLAGRDRLRRVVRRQLAAAARA